MTGSVENLYSERVVKTWREKPRDGIRDDTSIGLHWGLPFSDSFPLDDLARAAGEALALDGAWACQYGGGEKTRLLSRLISDRLAGRGLRLDERELLVTNGAAQAIDLLASAFLDPGDLVVVEAPTFMGALGLFRAHQAVFLPIEVDDQGMRVDLLQEDLLRRREDGRKLPKLAYVIPNFHNPTGVSMTPARRAALVNVAEEFNMVVVEDDAYGDLYFQDPPPRPVQALDAGGRVVYVGTLSKIIAPGIRIGWTLSCSAIADRINYVKGDGVTNPVIQSVVAQYWERGDLEARVVELRRAYRQRWETMETTLRRYMPDGVTWSQPGGGFFAWLSLPESAPAREVTKRAREQGVIVLPGDIFYPPGSEKPALRLSFSFSPARELSRGIRILADVVGEFV